MEQTPDREVWYTPQYYLAHPDLLIAERRIYYTRYGIPMYQAALKGDWEAMSHILRAFPEGITAGITKQGETALHIAALSRCTKFVQHLVASMTPNNLRIQSRKGNTALCLAAASGTVNIARVMVEKNRELPNIRGNADLTPLHMAALLGHKDMVNYLLPITTVLTTSDFNSLLVSLIDTDLYEIALEILRACPDLPIAQDRELTPLHILARKTGNCCRNEPSIWRRCHDLVAGLSEAHEENALPPEALHLIERLWERVMMLPEARISQLIARPTNLLFDAAKAGNVQFLCILIRSYPDLIWTIDSNSKTIFHVAVEHRQEKVFRLIHEFGAIKDLLATFIDPEENSMLHLAAKLPASDRLNCTSGPALQMQREMQWFKVVEGLMHRELVQSENESNQTPRALFSEQHQKLRKKGEKWMRITAASYSVVATLIVTMVFSAASKFLGGNNAEHYWQYFAFAIFDAVSLVYSTASILVFLSIMTSRYAEDDFLKVLPRKLLTGLILLVVAIATMMMAFFTIFYINFKRHFLWIVVPGLPGILMIIYFLLQDSLLIVYRLVAERNILHKPLHPGLLDGVDLSSVSLTSQFDHV